jgi:hypothetical protein
MSNYVNYHIMAAQHPAFATPGGGDRQGYDFAASGGDSADAMSEGQLEEAIRITLGVGPLNKLTAMPTMLQLKRFANMYGQRGNAEKGCEVIDQWLVQADHMYKTTSKTERRRYLHTLSHTHHLIRTSHTHHLMRIIIRRYFPSLEKARVHPRYSI